jgi:SAM-dependent methyltransferase
MVGLDLSEAMLAVARARLKAAGLQAPLVRGDVAAVPFARGSFGGALCMDSLLPLLLDDDMAAALAALRRSLRPGGVLVAEIYDYPGTLGEEPQGFYLSCFRAPWGRVYVRETHHYDREAGIWRMTQELTVLRGDDWKQFTVEHLLHIRPTDAYAAALEAAGFTILQLLPFYPHAPDRANERRMIFVARRN